MKFMNLTPHAVSIEQEDGAICQIPASGELARCSQSTEKVTVIDGIAVTRVTLGEVQGLPAPQKGTVYIVSRIIAEAVKGKRDDVLIPGPAIRDDEGRIIGAKGLSMV